MLCNKPSPDLSGSKITGFYFWIVLPQAKGWLNLAPIGFKSADYVYILLRPEPTLSILLRADQGSSGGPTRPNKHTGGLSLDPVCQSSIGQSKSDG